jgi:flagellar hook-associated protein 1 FlgK
MSFASISSIASSALSSAQVRMQVSASNIANADFGGYTTKTAVQAAVTTSGVGTGTTITAVSSSVDKYLQKDLVSEASQLGAATIAQQFADQLQSLMGETSSSDGSGTSLADALSEVQAALVTLSSTVESQTLAGLVVDALDTLAVQLRETSDGVQQLRADADQQITDAVDTANDAIETIAELNERIVVAKALGQSTADLEDQRFTALTSLSGVLDVSYTVKANGQMSVTAASGVTLVDGSAHLLSYDAVTTSTSETVFSGILVDGVDITSSLGSGSMAALVEQRDAVLPGTQASLDALAVALIDTLNAAHNTGSSLPAPTTLSGTTSVSAGDSLTASGTLRIVTVDDEGATLTSADLDLTAYASVDDLVAALDALDGIDASISSGRLVIGASDGAGVAVADIERSVGAAGQGFSDYFGLNDLLTGASAADIAVRSDLLSGETPLANAVLDVTGTLSVGDSAVSVSSSFAAGLAEALEGSTSFASTGLVGSGSYSLADYAATLVGAVASAADSADSQFETRQSAYESASTALTSQSGVNVDEETARLSELEQQYSVAAQILSVLAEMFDALLAAAKA